MVSLADQVHVSRLATEKTMGPLTFFLREARDDRAGVGAPGAAIAQLDAERLKVQAALVEAQRRTAELKEGEERYRSLFESMLEGVAYCQMLFDEDERPVDFVYLRGQSGLRTADRTDGCHGQSRHRRDSRDQEDKPGFVRELRPRGPDRSARAVRARFPTTPNVALNLCLQPPER